MATKSASTQPRTDRLLTVQRLQTAKRVIKSTGEFSNALATRSDRSFSQEDFSSERGCCAMRRENTLRRKPHARSMQDFMSVASRRNSYGKIWAGRPTANEVPSRRSARLLEYIYRLVCPATGSIRLRAKPANTRVERAHATEVHRLIARKPLMARTLFIPNSN